MTALAPSIVPATPAARKLSSAIRVGSPRHSRLTFVLLLLQLSGTVGQSVQPTYQLGSIVGSVAAASLVPSHRRELQAPSTSPAPAAPPALCIGAVTCVGMLAYASVGCSEFPVCAYGTDCTDCGSHAMQLPPPHLVLPPPRMPSTPGSISADTSSPPSPKSTAPQPLAPPSAPSPPRPLPPPSLTHSSSPPSSSLPPPQGTTLHTHANSAATGWKATALQGEMGRFACLLSMVLFAMAGLVVRLVGLFRALRSSTMRDGSQGARGSRRGRSQPGDAPWISNLQRGPISSEVQSPGDAPWRGLIAAAAAAAEAEAAVVVLAQDRCPICLEPLSADVRILACGHKMCVMPCYKSFMNLSVRPTREGNWNPQRILRACVGGYGPCLCPLCRAAIVNMTI